MWAIAHIQTNIMQYYIGAILVHVLSAIKLRTHLRYTKITSDIMVDTLELLKRYYIDDGTHSGDAHLKVLFKNIYYIFDLLSW